MQPFSCICTMASEAPAAAAAAPAAASTDVVYRIIAASEWLAAKDAGAYVGTALDEKDGYIHCSTAKQVVGTLGRYFKGKTGLAVLVVGECSQWASLSSPLHLPLN